MMDCEKDEPLGFVLGEYDVRAANHAQKVIRHMMGREPKPGEAHAVTVAIYVDGRLQFAGSDCRPHRGRDVVKYEARQVATVIAQRMNPYGECAKVAEIPMPRRSCAEVCEELRQMASANALRQSPNAEPQCFGLPASVFFRRVADRFEEAHRYEMEQECNGEKRLADTVLFANRDNALKYLRERYDAARKEANSASGEFNEFASDYSEDGWYVVVYADGNLKEGYLSGGMEVRGIKPRTTEIALSLIAKVRDGVLAIGESHGKRETGHDILVAHNCDDLLLRIDAVRRMVEGGAV